MATLGVVLAALVTALLLPRLERRRRESRRLRQRVERRVDLLETARALPGQDLAEAARLACHGLRSLGFDAAAVSVRRGPFIEPSDEEIVIAETVAVHLGRAFSAAADIAAQEQLLDRLRHLDQLRSAFVAEVSEELRDALTVIRGRTRSLVDDGDQLDDAQRQRLLARLEVEVEALRLTIDALLDFSRFQAARPEPTLRSLPLGHLLGPLIDRGRLRVDGEIETLPPVRIDPERVRQALELLFGLGGHVGTVEVHADHGGSVRLRLPGPVVTPDGVVGALAEQLLVSGGAILDPDQPRDVLLAAVVVEVGR